MGAQKRERVRDEYLCARQGKAHVAAKGISMLCGVGYQHRALRRRGSASSFSPGPFGGLRATLLASTRQIKKILTERKTDVKNCRQEMDVGLFLDKFRAKENVVSQIRVLM